MVTNVTRGPIWGSTACILNVHINTNYTSLIPVRQVRGEEGGENRQLG